MSLKFVVVLETETITGSQKKTGVGGKRMKRWLGQGRGGHDASRFLGNSISKLSFLFSWLNIVCVVNE